MTKILKSDKEIEDFDPEKLRGSILKSGASPETAEEIIKHVENEIKEGMSTSQIYKHTAFLLDKKSRKVAVSYSLKRAVMDLGPSGFPFERFLGELLKEKGYEVRVGEILKGNCTDYEIDVVAYNENKLFIIEAKFHNSLGIKSDVKTALYVKARFNDLKDSEHGFGERRKIDENWLVTNTKFTSKALEYGKCANLVMISWNYPKEGNLQDMIEDSGLHPLTCLKSLNQNQKKEILKTGTVLCKKLKGNKGLLGSVGIKDNKAKEVEDEISLICEI